MNEPAASQTDLNGSTFFELFECAPFGMYVVDSHFRIAQMNRSARDGAFRNVHPVIGRDFAEAMRILWPEAVAADIVAAFRRTLETGEAYRSPRFTNPRHDITTVESYEWELHRMPLANGGYGVVCYYFDSTQLRRTLAALRESEEKYRALFESIDQGFCIVEVLFDERERPVDYRFLLVNPAFERQTGIRDAVGRRMREILPLHEEHWFRFYGTIALTGEPMRFESRAAQLHRHYEVFAWRVGAPEERKVAILFNDITAHKNLIEAEARARATAEAATRAKSAFLANMSHEIRTPLHVIIGLAHLLQQEMTDTLQRQRVDDLCATSEHLLALLNDILDISKIEAERLALHVADFRLGEVVSRVENLVAETAREKALALVIDVPRQLREITLRGDALRLIQVLANLCSNAIKFTERGYVRLSVARTGESADGGERLCFAVEDTGIGMGADVQMQLFKPFVQADGASTRRHGGSGLGLAISQNLVALMGGRIRVESHVGLGSRFSFELVLPLGSAPASPAATAQGDLAGRRVLLVEDHPLSQDILFQMLDNLGCEVEVASDGAEAVECAREHAFDFILMDMQMPKMDGLDAARAIRALGLHRRTPIVALTANAYAEDRQRCLDAGMNDHICKPITPPQLAATLSRWVGGIPAPQMEDEAADGELGKALAMIPGLEVPPGMRRSVKDLAQLLRRFVETHGADMTRLLAHFGAGDAEAAHTIAHNLKGVAGLLGARTIAALAQEIAHELRFDTDADHLQDLTRKCELELAHMGEAIRSLPVEPATVH